MTAAETDVDNEIHDVPPWLSSIADTAKTLTWHLPPGLGFPS